MDGLLKKWMIWKILGVVLPILMGLLMCIMVIMAIVSNSASSCFSENTPPSVQEGSKGSNQNAPWRDQNSDVYKGMKYAATKLHSDTGMSADNVAAALAVGWRESRFDPTAYNPGGDVIGIWQWGKGIINGNRYGDTEPTVEAQVALAIRELKSTHIATLSGLKGADIMNSIIAWDTHFEGLPPSDSAQRKSEEVYQNAVDIKKALGLDFEGKIDIGNSMVDKGDTSNNLGAAEDAMSCKNNLNGTTSGLPVAGKYNVTGGYPNYQGAGGSGHGGVDFQTVDLKGDAANVYSVSDGVVVVKSFHPISGNFVVVKNVDGVYAYYGHAPTQETIVVEVGDRVKIGQHISKQGETGAATGIHVHFALNSRNNYAFSPNSSGLENPGKYLKNLPKEVIKPNDIVVPGGVFDANANAS